MAKLALPDFIEYNFEIPYKNKAEQARQLHFNKMIGVDKNLCIGCGKCLQVCPNQAISIFDAKAEINQRLCSECYRCLEVCPREAIGNKISINVVEIRKSLQNAKDRLGSLKAKVSLAEKIEK